MNTYKKNPITFTLTLALSLAVIGTAQAEEAKEKKEAAPTPVSEYAQEVKDLVESLNEEQAKKYTLIRHTHGVIRSVQSVEKHVAKAVKACKGNHKELGKNIESRFNEWKVAIHPVIKSGEDRLEKLILLQDYAKPSDVKQHLENYDKAALYGEKLMDLKPASDKESCNKLLKSMDKTQPDLIRLLKENIGVE